MEMLITTQHPINLKWNVPLIRVGNSIRHNGLMEYIVLKQDWYQDYYSFFFLQENAIDPNQIELFSPHRPFFKIAYKKKKIFLFLNQNICCGYSKEQSQ